MSHVIRCELAPPHRRAAPALARSFVHHQCRLADVDVSTIEALEEAAAEVIDDVMADRCEVVEISLDPDFFGLDLLISTSVISTSVRPAGGFRAGLVARATFDEIVVGGGSIRLIHRFRDRPRA